MNTLTLSITTGVTPIDTAVRGHLSQRYWDWRRLYDADPQACPLQHPDVVLTDLDHAPRAKLSPLLAHADHDHECVGIGALVPKLVHSRRLGAVPLGRRMEGYRLTGNGFAVSDSAPEVIAALWECALTETRRRGAEFLLIEDLDDAHPLATLIDAELPRGWSVHRHAGRQPRRRIELPATPEAYWQKFSSKTRQTFRRKLKKFGATRLDRCMTVADVPRFLDAAHEISRHTWQTRQFGLRVRHDAGTLAQFTKLAELGLFRSYLWCVEDRPVAFTVGNQDHGVFHYEEVGYLPEFAKFSPGQMMLIQMIDDLITHQPATWFDFGGGDADYKELFANHTSRSGTVWLFPPTLAGRLTQTHLHTSLAARQWVRRQIAERGWTTRFRQWVRGAGQSSRDPQGNAEEAQG